MLKAKYQTKRFLTRFKKWLEVRNSTYTAPHFFFDEKELYEVLKDDPKRYVVPMQDMRLSYTISDIVEVVELEKVSMKKMTPVISLFISFHPMLAPFCVKLIVTDDEVVCKVSSEHPVFRRFIRTILEVIPNESYSHEKIKTKIETTTNKDHALP